MKISYTWLNTLINHELTIEQCSDILTDIGLEVEGVSAYESVKGKLKGVVVGKVITCKKHPNADKLFLSKVDIGLDTPLQIVCGASNISVGQKVPVATLGTYLYDDEENPFKIKKSKIRGEYSEGMICSEKELNLGNDDSGIYILPESQEIGTLLSDVFDVSEDYQLEIGLTPNRNDAMGHWGVARDLHAKLKRLGKNSILIRPKQLSGDSASILPIDIEVINKEKAPIYMGYVISELKIEESPIWLKNRLECIGIKPVNNLVDISNYVCHELGQPLHAFDYDKIKNQKILVRNAFKDEKIITLDEVERLLSEDDLVICNEDQPMCIAGVFGGKLSGVRDSTNTIFLEAAYFEPNSVRSSSKRHGLHTDASFRFERGVDPNSVEDALNRAAFLYCSLAKGKIASSLIKKVSQIFSNKTIELRFNKLFSTIGQNIPKKMLESILKSLDFKIITKKADKLILEAPTYRGDVTREIDVIEEVLRIYGYNDIYEPEKLSFSINEDTGFKFNYLTKEKLSNMLVFNGFYEVMNNSLTSELNSDNYAISIINSSSNQLKNLRTHLLENLIENIRYNYNRQTTTFRIFEWGKTYKKVDNDYMEKEILGIVLSGNISLDNWRVKNRPYDLFDLKGIIENICFYCNLNFIMENIDDLRFLECLSLVSEGNEMGRLGIINPKTIEEKFAYPIIYCELYWEKFVLKMERFDSFKIKTPSKYPFVRRDCAFIVDNDVRYQDMKNIAFATEKKYLKKVSLFDVYRGKKIPNGKKSYAISFIIESNDETLTDIQINRIINDIIHNLKKAHNAILREN